MNKKILPFILLVFFNSTCIFGQSAPPDAQVQLEKIIPVSPTAASIAKYGNIPVSYFTGLPNINIPLYEVVSGGLIVPVTLSYQNNGLKVEEIASWVGLGWSLQAGGSISRSIRGIADEVPNGYMDAGIPMTVKFMIDNMTNPAYSENIKYYLRQAGKGLYDTEPDIFYFSFPGYSGKFYYNQEDHKFYTLPAQNIKIGRENNGFFIITENGNKHFFTIPEYTNANPPQCSGTSAQSGIGPTITSWYLSKIENNNQTDEVIFEYTDIFYSFDNISTSSKYALLFSQGSASPHSNPPDFPNQSCWQTTFINGKLLSFIRFRDGYVKFSAFTNTRCDLSMDKALEKVELFDKADNFIKTYRFEYGYFGDADNPSNCNTGFSLRRLKLKSVREEVGNGQQLNPHIFEYEENGPFPGRLSYAQDYWGYYNGATTNQNLIPTVFYYDFWGNGRYVPGADRKPNFNYAKLGTIKKVTYPTKGTSEFEFENNEVKDPFIQPEFQIHTEFLEGDHNGVQTVYEKIFTVNETPNFFNFNLPNGGAFVDVSFADIGCTFPIGQADTCAILTIENISGMTLLGPFTRPLEGSYLANGTYKLKAVFNQYPPGFADFYYSLTWKQPILNNSYLAGGLRIKSIKDYDNIDVTNKVVRNFSYSSEADGLSSGKACGYPNDYTTNFTHEFYSGQNVGYCIGFSLIRDYVKMTSTSNYSLIAHQGGYVGYEEVTIKYGENSENGKSTFKFQYIPDIISGFPNFATSKEWQRGMLLQENQYQKEGNSLSIKSAATNTYDDLRSVDAGLLQISYALKPFFNVSMSMDASDCGLSFWSQRENELALPVVDEYETITGNSLLATKNSITYEGSSQLQTSEEVFYNNKNYLAKEMASDNSKGQMIIKKAKFNVDYTIINGNPAWLQQLSSHNISAAPVEKLTIRKNLDGTLYVIGGIITTYRNDKPLRDKVYVLRINAPILFSSFIESYVDGNGNFIKDTRYQDELSVNVYDEYNNIREQQKTGDVKNSYIWGHHKTLPVAEVINAADGRCAFTSFEDDANNTWSFSGLSSIDNTAITGKRSYNFNGANSITKTGLNSQSSYIVSYWTKNATAFTITGTQAGYPVSGSTIDGWKLFAHKITGLSTVTISGTGVIDELRLYPEMALMTTMTYEPLIGMTSQCDANNRIIYYEYDSFNRLSLIRDQDNNIVKKICYNYAGQVEDCESTCINTEPIWQNTNTPIRCQTANTCGFTGNVEQEQKDINLCSFTHNDTRWVVVNYSPNFCTATPAMFITYNVSVQAAGFTAEYTDNNRISVFTEPISTGSGTLLCLPDYTGYLLKITKPGNTTNYIFSDGCTAITGTSALFRRSAYGGNCINITIVPE